MKMKNQSFEDFKEGDIAYYTIMDFEVPIKIKKVVLYDGTFLSSEKYSKDVILLNLKYIHSEHCIIRKDIESIKNVLLKELKRLHDGELNFINLKYKKIREDIEKC